MSNMEQDDFFIEIQKDFLDEATFLLEDCEEAFVDKNIEGKI